MKPRVTADIQMMPEEQGGRHAPLAAGYCPHLVISDSADLIAVRVLSVERSGTAKEIFPGAAGTVIFELMFHPHPAGVDLLENCQFSMREGNRIVGVGTVLQRLNPVWKHPAPDRSKSVYSSLPTAMDVGCAMHPF
ncbi:MAG TPA: hypothetical protein VF719_10700, partial [Abditibacteriaceae bacterium]